MQKCLKYEENHAKAALSTREIKPNMAKYEEHHANNALSAREIMLKNALSAMERVQNMR